MRASIRGPPSRNIRGESPPRQTPLPIFEPRRSTRPVLASIGPGSRDPTEQSQVQKAERPLQQLNTKRLAQQYDALASSAKHATLGLGLRRHGGSSAFRVEKKQPTNRANSTSKRTDGPRDQIGEKSPFLSDPRPSQALCLADLDPEPDHNLSEAIRRTSQSRPTTEMKFNGTKSIHQERQSHFNSGKKQEDLYLAQTRLLQWYLMGRKVSKEFTVQEARIKVERSTLESEVQEKQSTLRDLQQRFAIEKQLAELESSFGRQREQVMTVVIGLESLRPQYEDTILALEGNAPVLSIPAFDDNHLEYWLTQVRSCQSSVEANLKKVDGDRLLFNGLIQLLGQVCACVQEEILELQHCSKLLVKLRQAKELEQSLQDAR
ncbi:hypothetical protein EMPS_01383 [Entomortierella parvispora]|uniref:Uncharacterized protein n=1 Tax=Entomortierella parvispora TaxID=205924 RepID=A0A9P3LSR6_9FUNG|nr:hypothetical protein EMPS_01383 [Entomortierella parvispora]